MKLLFYIAFLFAFFLPLNTSISNILLVLLVAVSIYYVFLNKNLSLFKVKNFKLFYSTLPIFLLFLLGLFFLNEIGSSVKYFERIIPFVLVPIIWLFISKNDLLELKNHLLVGLLVGSLLSSFILIGINFYNFFMEFDDINSNILGYYYTSIHFAKPLGIHPTYLGIYYLTSILFVSICTKNLKIQILLLFVLCISLLFLNSRIIYFGFFLISSRMGYLKFRWMLLKREYKKLIYMSVCLGLVGFLCITTISKTYVGTRVKNVYKFEMSANKEENFNTFNKGNPRMARWKSALKLIKKEPFFGYGLNKEYTSLKDQFVKDGLFYAAGSNYNSHNQFLGYTIRFGMLGLLALVFFFLSNLIISFLAADYKYTLLIIIVLATNLVENYIDRNAGVTFIAVFFTAFTYVSLEER